MPIIFVSSNDVFILLVKKYISCKKIGRSWNLNDKVNDEKVLPLLIKSTSAFTAAIADCHH